MGLKVDCVPKTVQQSRALRDFRNSRAPRIPASAEAVYTPERLTLAGWIALTGEGAPSEAAGPAEVDPEAVAAEVRGGDLFVEPNSGGWWG